MALFGSRFATGFITGLAETSNEALKGSIKRIRTNVDDLAKIQFERALDDQEERKKEFKEAETALNEAAAVFGKDPNAADYAGALLKESGSIAAFKQEIAKLREAKQNNVPIVDFFNRAKQDAPSGTVKDYAKAYVASNRTLPSYKVPAGAVSTDGGLVSAIFGDIDVAGRVDKKVEQQMAAAGITQQQPTAFAPPSISYDREGLSMYKMTPSKRIEYIRQELTRPQNTQKRVDELKGMLNDNLNAAIKDSDLETKLSALKTQRSNAEPNQVAGINEEILKTQREIELNQAITEKDKLEVRIKHAGEDGKRQEVITLQRKFDDMTNPVTLSVSLAREKEDLEIAMANNAMNPEDFDKALASIRKKENVLKEIGGENILDLADINAANTAIGRAMNDLLGNAVFDPAIETVKSDQDGSPIPIFKAGIDEDTKNRLLAAFDNARRVAINMYKTSMTEQENYKAVKAIEYVEKMYGEFEEARTESGAESGDLTIGDITIPSSVINSIAAANDKTTKFVADSISNTVTKYKPNDITSAAKFVQDAGDAAASEIAELESYGVYSPEWIAAAKKAAEGTSGVEDVVENTIDPQVTSAIDALEQGDFSALSGRMPKIKAIMSALNVNREDAQRLLPLAEAGLTKRKAESSVSSGDAGPREYRQLVQAAQTQSEYDAAVQAYSDSSNLDVDYIKKRYPFKQNKNQGGLMSRRGS
tara:strand:- start:3755 stop:5872 length:2118 start_codon:yes stop_codon:yes gene_type:complete